MYSEEQYYKTLEVYKATGFITKTITIEVALSVLLRIRAYLNCDIGEICEAVKNKEN